MDVQYHTCMIKLWPPCSAASALLGAPAMIHTARHVDHEKIVLWFSICSRACGSVSILMGLCLAAAAGSSAIKVAVLKIVSQKMEGSNKFMI